MIKPKWILQHIMLSCLSGVLTISAQTFTASPIIFYPANNSQNINPDTHLKITFPGTPILGSSGKISIYDISDNRLVDQLDISIPAGPTDSTTPRSVSKPPYLQVPYKYNPGKFTNANTKPGTPSGGALPTPNNYQLTIIGGFTDGFHFYPVIINNQTATIYLHNNLLEYNKTYYVQIDPGVLRLKDNSFSGITGKSTWVFSTKKLPPSPNSERMVVSDDGTGDFNTVQGAIDLIPDNNPKQIIIFIKNGVYEEIVYFRNKANITILGEDRDKVVIKYANKETFNPHPSNISTNEVEGTFPSRRAAFSVDHSSRIHLINLSIMTTSTRAQAEGLLLNGSENIVYNVNISGSGDALQSNGSTYYSGCRIEGAGDIILGRGPSYFKDCDLYSSGGPYMWIRNSSANHGNIFVNCKFKTSEGRETEIARSPTNGGKNYPYSEAVLINCKLEGISPIGWGPIGSDSSNIHNWEFNSTTFSDEPIDVSGRHPASRRLNTKNDSEIIANYSNPSYILGNWSPAMSPILLLQPKSLNAIKGQAASFNVDAASIPEADYQWFKDGKLLPGAIKPILNIANVNSNDTGSYFVVVKNSLGSITSVKASLTFSTSTFEDLLRTKIEHIVDSASGKVGVAILGFENYDTLSINGNDKFPMQSVFKFPLALAVLNQVDKGIFSLEQKIHLNKEDLLPDTWSPLRKKYPEGDVNITLDELLTATVSESDNNGCDKLFRLIGGPNKVEQYIHGLGITDIAIVATEADMHKDWQIQYHNYCTPAAMTQLLNKFFNGNILSEKSRNYLYQVMAKTTNSPGRLKRLLPEGTIVAHKTGSSGENEQGLAAATNDVGIISLPNGKHIIISAFVSDSRADEKTRDNIIAEISKTVWDNYQNNH